MMAALPFTIRPERTDETAAIGALLDAAFSGPVEGRLVENLRAGGDLVLALAAAETSDVVGYVAWPRLHVETPQGDVRAVGLAPLAVSPPRQRAGIGAALVEAGLARLRAKGETLAFVLGDPAYYRRFGFSVDAARAYESTYAGEHFMVLALAAGAPRAGRVRYPAPFAALA